MKKTEKKIDKNDLIEEIRFINMMENIFYRIMIVFVIGIVVLVFVGLFILFAISMNYDYKIVKSIISVFEVSVCILCIMIGLGAIYCITRIIYRDIKKIIKKRN